MDRRSFFGPIAAAAIARRSLSRTVDGQRIRKIGLQLYTVREELKNHFDGALAKVAGLGYHEVELGGFVDNTPPIVRDALLRHGLVAPSTQIPYQNLLKAWPKFMEDSHMIGQAYIFNPWIDDEVQNQPDGWKRAAGTFKRAGEFSEKAGIQLAYHSHWLEFVPGQDGTCPYDLLLTECGPDLVKKEIDLCWITMGGSFAGANMTEITEVGSGIMNC